MHYAILREGSNVVALTRIENVSSPYSLTQVIMRYVDLTLVSP